MKVRSAAQTHVGKVRKENEDRFLHDPKRLLFGVADGIGGLPGGGEAAQAAVNAVHQKADELNDPASIEAIVLAAHDAVLDLSEELSPEMGMGTTLTIGWFDHGRLFIGHVGDSRCYLLRDGKLLCLTEDDSVENELKRRIKRGEQITISERHRNELTRCIGQPMDLRPSVQTVKLHPGDRFFFSSDGICRVIGDDKVQELLSGTNSPDDTMTRLIDCAINNGGPDNATGVIVDILET